MLGLLAAKVGYSGFDDLHSGRYDREVTKPSTCSNSMRAPPNHRHSQDVVAAMALRSDMPVDEKLSRLASFSDAVSRIDASDVMVTAMWATPSE
jgi:hypothetical protein